MIPNTDLTNEQHNTDPRRRVRAITRHLPLVIAHVTGVVAAHAAALVVLEKTPLYILLGLH
jgi:hypothetical protein